MALNDGQITATPFFRLRWLLELTADTEVHPHQGATVYALLANANRGAVGTPAMPDGLLIDVPEQCRTRLRAGEWFAFGGTWIDPDRQVLAERLWALVGGLRRLGRQAKARRQGLGGNFRLVAVEDLVADRRLKPGDLPEPIPTDHIDDQIVRLLPLEALTLRFTSPLRLERPRGESDPGHRYFDGEYFRPDYFFRRLARRLLALGIRRRDHPEPDSLIPLGPHDVQLVENRLVWLDLEYGSLQGRKSLGGAVGRVRLTLRSDLAKAALVWGQYARLGKNLHFGLGAYRIEELGQQAFACRRAIGLVELAMRSPALDRIAQHSEVPSGQLRVAAAEVQSGRYRPGPVAVVDTPSNQGQPRRLSIPAPVDRGLQRLVLEVLAPALDRFFESSSIAWRRGLGRHRAPARVQAAFREGFRYALRENFHRFFDNIDHRELSDRLEAYVADDQMVALVMSWVQAGTSTPGRGIPTGAPLSPLLGNLLLDRFDEQIAAQGARLIRYADDFLVLCRTAQQAEALYQTAAQAAHDLKLALNSTGPEVLDFSEPFDFLGFRFQKQESWEAVGDGPQPLDQIGWFDVAKQAARHLPQIVLPGERAEPASASDVAVIGPEIAELALDKEHLEYRYHGQQPRRIPLGSLESLILLGPVTLPGALIERSSRHGPTILVADPSGLPLASLIAPGCDDPHVILAQARAAESPHRRLAFAQAFVAAKLNNDAALAQALADPDGPALAQQLRSAAGRAAQADGLDELRGIEGAAAARWYTLFAHCLGPGFKFERRTAPNAEDPVNVLLNIGHTWLYRWMILAARAAGLSPSLGLLHTGDGRFAALAADLQEPFRHLVDRVVLEATFQVKPNQFQPSQTGPFALRLSPHAARQFQFLLQQSFSLAAVGRDQTEPYSYRLQFLRQARSLRRHLVNPLEPFLPFVHP